ncbi:MAG: 2,3-bisphosphoglycerate-independent phosphoglycerate mutase [Pseudomonadales bacterium]
MQAATTLIILDGFGHREESDANAIALANTPFLDALYRDAPNSLVSGSGLDVGLPEGQMGNSEVGHMNLGAGRVVHQEFTRINEAIQNQSFFDNPVLNEGFTSLAQSGRTLHILGLLSPGGVHSHEDQIHAAIRSAHQQGVKQIRVHAFLDGRDVPPKSARASLEKITACLETLAVGQVASITGRYFAMDRDNRWDRVRKAYDVICSASAQWTFETPLAALEAAYDRGETDEFVQPSAIAGDLSPCRVEDGDQILFMNFRADRARELTEAFVATTFTGFARSKTPSLARFTTLTQYSQSLPVPCAFPPATIHNSLGEHLSQLGFKQLRIAETEKYAHVTFFFSCGRERPYPLEDRILVPSPDVATYDLAPSMSAPEVTRRLCEAITQGDYKLIVCNFANGDMVGHTGNLSAAIQAVEALDQCLSKVVAASRSAGGQILITADHGNCEQMTDNTSGQPHTAHTCEQVPLIYVGPRTVNIRPGGVLSDLAPTLLDLMDLPTPKEMTGQSLIQIDQADKALRP